MRRRIVIPLLCVVTAMVCGVFIACLVTRNSQDPRTNVGYWLWRARLAPFSRAYREVIARDSSHWVGMSIEDFRRRVGPLYEGRRFAKRSYRGEFAWERPESEACYWFDDDADGWGWCVVAERGRITRFAHIKG